MVSSQTIAAREVAVLPPCKRVVDRPSPPASELAQTLAVLGQPVRLRIFALLTKRELCVCEITDALGLRQNLVSNHLRVLKRAGLVRARRDAVDSRWVYYSLDVAAVEGLRASLVALLDLSDLDATPAHC